MTMIGILTQKASEVPHVEEDDVPAQSMIETVLVAERIQGQGHSQLLIQ